MATIRILFVDDSCTDAELAETELEQSGIYAQSLTVADEDSLRIALENWDPEVIVASSTATDFIEGLSPEPAKSCTFTTRGRMLGNDWSGNACWNIWLAVSRLTSRRHTLMNGRSCCSPSGHRIAGRRSARS